MTKVNVLDIADRIVSTTNVRNKNSNIVIDRDPNYVSNTRKVNINSMNNLLRNPNGKAIVEAKFDVSLDTYETATEIEMMKSLLRIKCVRYSSRGKIYDLADDHLFRRLKRLEQIKVVVSLLQYDITVVVDGYEELPTQSNIDQLNQLIKKEEIKAIKTKSDIDSNIAKMARLK